MVCLYCGARLPLLRNLELGEFCSAAHREQFERLQHEFQEGEAGELPKPPPLVSLPVKIRPRNRQLRRPLQVRANLRRTPPAVPPRNATLKPREPRACGRLGGIPVIAEPGYVGTITHAAPCLANAGNGHRMPELPVRVPGPRHRGADRPLPLSLVPLKQTSPEPLARPIMVRLLSEPDLAPLHARIVDTLEAMRSVAAPPPPPPAPRRMFLRAFPKPGWRSLALAASAAILVVLFARGWQPVKAAENQALPGGWDQMKKDIAGRAAIDMVDDFRTGLDSWSSRRANLGWSYDRVGFIRPTSLAVYDPSLKLTDYSFEFLGQLRNKGMGVAVRAADLNNYYAVRLAVVRPGPFPSLEVVRYPVIGGREGKHVSHPLPVSIRPDSLFRARILANGDEFTLMVQDQVVDFWSDARFRKGGVGFFCLRGDDARLRWVEITHHDDTLGRLCALIAPYNVAAANGSWEK